MLNSIISNQPRSEFSKISLQSMKFEITIANHLTTLSVYQDFVNIGAFPVECEYEFPISSDSVVTALNILLPDGTVLNSHIEEEDKALETYQDALSQGNAAVLGKSENLDSMVVYIGNIQSSQSVKIQITISSPLSAESNFWKYSVPSKFLLNQPDPSSLPYFIEAKIEIKSLGAISDYNSNWDILWDLAEDRQNLTGRINCTSQVRAPLSFMYRNESINTPTCITQRKGDKYAAMLSFIPQNTDGKDPEYIEGTGEYIFILDRSGSMNGQRINIAKNAALIFLKSLPLNSKFNIISFGGDAEKMFTFPERASSENISRAISRLEEMSADMGGTNIFRALELVFQITADNQYPRNLFLLTDGGEGNSEHSLNLIKENKSTCRIHGFGIQSSPTEAKFISEAAELGRGSAFFVNNIEDLGSNVIKALSKCIMPCMNQWEISWTGKAVPTSKNIGSVYYGEIFTQYLLMDALPYSLPVISYFDTYQKQEVQVNIQRVEAVEGEQVFKLWAKNQINEYILNKTQNSKEIIEISKEFQVVSPLTAFVCVKTQDGEAKSDMKTIKITSRSNFQSIPPRITSYMMPNSTPNIMCALFMDARSSPNPTSAYIPNSAPPPPPIMRPTTQFMNYSIPPPSLGCPPPPPLGGPPPPPRMNAPVQHLNYSIPPPPSRSPPAPCQDLFGEFDMWPSHVFSSSSQSMNIMPTMAMSAPPAPPLLNLDSRATEENLDKKKVSPAHSGVSWRLDSSSYDSLSSANKGYWEYDEMIVMFQELVSDYMEMQEVDKNIVATVFVLCVLNKRFLHKLDEWKLLKRKAMNWLTNAGIDYEVYKHRIQSS